MKHEEILKTMKNTGKAKDFVLHELAFKTGPDRLHKMIAEHLEDFNLIDVRDYDDYIKSHIPYAVHIPMEQLDDQLEKLSKDKINIFYSYCPLCQRCVKAAYIAADKGYPSMTLIGGFKGWKKREFDVVEDDVSDYPG